MYFSILYGLLFNKLIIIFEKFIEEKIIFSEIVFKLTCVF